MTMISYHTVRMAGDMVHLASFLVLLVTMHKSKSCRGISLKSQVLHTVVFVTRYLDLSWNFISTYNSIMKVIFIALSFSILLYMQLHPVEEQDAYPILFLILPCAALAILVNTWTSDTVFVRGWLLFEIAWTFSTFLEAVAILPQRVLMQRTQRIDNPVGLYVLLLGMYRGLYILNWIYRYYMEMERFYYWQPTAWISGVVQMLFYLDFFYHYRKCLRHHQKLSLPNEKPSSSHPDDQHHQLVVPLLSSQ